MQNQNTKQRIAETFLALAETTDPLKITISAISSEMGINRKTFYYYFPNKESLVIWIFRRDLGHMLKDALPQSQLVFEQKDSTPYAKYPYYVSIKKEDGGLAHDAFFLTLAHCLLARRKYYTQILRTTEAGSLYHYLLMLYCNEIRKDLLYLFEGKTLSDESVDFLAELFAAAMLGQISNRIASHGNCRDLEDVFPFNNIIHDSLYLIAHRFE